MKLKDIGEWSIISRYIYPLLSENFRDEDAAILKLDEKKFLVVNVDTFVRKTDAPRQMTPYFIGWKTVTSCVSDIIAKGAEPQYFLLSIVAPSELELAYLKDVLQGVVDACLYYRCHYVGGDTNAGDDLILTGVAIGFTDQVIRRNTAKPKESVWVTGPFGFTGVALHYLLNKGMYVSGLELALEKFFKPQINPQLAYVLKEVASASIDSSDGLVASLYQLSSASNIAVFISRNIFVPELVKLYSKKNSLNVMDLILYGGEEYEIVFTTSLSDDKVRDIFQRRGLPQPIKIGITAPGNGVYFESKKIERKGWQHFKEEV